MPGKENILYADFPNKINRSLNIIGAVRELFMRCPALDAFLPRRRNVRDSIVAAVVERKYSRLPVSQLLRNRELAEHRASEPVHPYDYPLRLRRPEPQSVQDELFRRRYLDDMTRPHSYFLFHTYCLS